MPITVRHGGGDISGLAQLIAIAGSMQTRAPQAPQVELPRGPNIPGGGGGGMRRAGPSTRDTFARQTAELKAARDAQMRDIEARADREKQSADDAMKRVTLQAGLGREMQDQEFDLEVKMLQEQAKAKASEFDWKFSVETKYRMSENASKRQALSDALEEDRIDQDQFEAYDSELVRQFSGFAPTPHPADVNKPPPAQEQVWTDPKTGALMGIDRSGNPRLLLTPDKNPEFIREQNQVKARQAALDAREKMLATAVSTTVKNLDTGKDERLSSSEVSAMMAEYDAQVAAYENRGQDQPTAGGLSGYTDQRNEAARVEAKRKWDEQHAPTGQQAESWSTKLETAGINVGEFKIPVKVKSWQAELPPEVGAKLAMFDAMEKKFGGYNNVPAKLKPAYTALLKFAEEYYGQR